jgi:hypothetical protein
VTDPAANSIIAKPVHRLTRLCCRASGSAFIIQSAYKIGSLRSGNIGFQRKDFGMKPLISCFALAGVMMATVVSTSATPLYSAAALAKPSANIIHVAEKKSQKKINRSNYNASQGYIPGHVRTPYGYGDCIGWWERHPDGRMQCHGQLILNHWND